MKPGAKNHNISLKNLNLRLKNLKPRFNRGAKNHNSTSHHHVPARVSYNLIPILLAAACFIASPCAFATDATASSGMRFNVQNAYSIEIILPELDALSLTPTSAGAFTSQNITIGVGTSNPSGYTLTMSAESTDMTRSAAVNGSTPTIPTLFSGGGE
ncbi:hypothetical protein IJG90_03415 [Candidatus Saccharibacteria bacterium]|nr:hypothetical protein [Candidatus Saccharibacteria bacterium]